MKQLFGSLPDGRKVRQYTLTDGRISCDVPDYGATLRVFSTQPGLQFYTGNYPGGDPVGKGGAVYRKRGGFCLETQAFPDAPNKENFPSAVLRPGEFYHQVTIFRFG